MPPLADDLRIHATATAEGANAGVTLAEHWNVGRNQNGGVLLATVAGLMASVADQPHPLAVTGHFLGATTSGTAAVDARLLKPGRTYATAEGSVAQEGVTKARAVGAFGDLGGRAGAGPSYFPAPAPNLPPPEQCEDLFDHLVARVGERSLTSSLRNFEMRTAPGGAGNAGADEPSLRCWVRLRDDETVSPLMLVAVADGFPPTLLGHVEMGWLPTVELTVHVFAVPVPDEPWLRAELRTRTVLGGLLDEDGELWDASGRLVARFRQMAMLIPPQPS